MRVIILVITIIINIFAKEVYISFSFVSKNSILTYSNFNCSIAASSCKDKRFVFYIPTSEDDIKRFCKANKEKIIQKLIKMGVVIYSNEKIYQERTKLTFTPKLFDIIIKGNGAYFYECKE